MENIVVESHNGFAPVFYIIVAVIVVILVSIVLLIKKKSWNLNQLLMIFKKSLFITFGINLILFIFLFLTSREIMCGICREGIKCCSSKLEMIFSGLVYSIPLIFLISLLIIVIFKKRNIDQVV